MEQHARAKRLAIPVFELELSVVHRHAERKRMGDMLAG
jgi:hypothetical protein